MQSTDEFWAVCFGQVISLVGLRRGGTTLIHLVVALFLNLVIFIAEEFKQ